MKHFFYGLGSLLLLSLLVHFGLKWYQGRKGVSSVKKYNRLGESKSPYLLQHKDNPVHWFSWGEEAFNAARQENKLIFLSIGYSTCYWCHMMEKDSFEIQEVADVLNKDFISIKVDREEHPDVDQIYMDAVIGLTGGGGWPMSVFLTPDLKPFTGGTFFWRAQFLQILSKVQEVWQKNPESIVEQGKQLTQFIQEKSKTGTEQNFNEEILKKAFHQFQESFDPVWGGFGRAPKFPHSLNISLLLRVYHRSGKPEALTIATKTLDAMAAGGLFDQIGGGFHRYATDDTWLTPHFEKMLYDNALLASTYLEAYQATQNKLYAEVAKQIFQFILTEMKDPQGGFYSALDAGEVGSEGHFYSWSEAELKKNLDPEEFSAFKKLYSITPHGNFEEGLNILHIANLEDWGKKINSPLKQAHQKLYNLRMQRTHPRKDDKVLTSWNGLMIAALAKGFQVLDNPTYLQAAQSSARFIKNHLWKNNLLLRRYRDGESHYDGTLDDYAFLIHGLLSLYESDFDAQWIHWGEELQKVQDARFWDNETGGYFFGDPHDKTLVVQKKEFHDGATPSGNSMAAYNLLRLFALTFDKKYLDRAEKLLKIIAGNAQDYPAGFAQGLIAIDFYLDRSKEIVVVGDKNDNNYNNLQRYLYKNFIPNKVIAFGQETPRDVTIVLPILKDKKMLSNKTTIFICENNVCKAPVHDLETAKPLILKIKKYEL